MAADSAPAPTIFRFATAVLACARRSARQRPSAAGTGAPAARGAARALLLVALACIDAPVAADTLTGALVRVLDGDTVEVRDAGNDLHRIRLAGIDAPESGQPFGTQAKRHLLALVGGASVTVDWHKRDRYGRIVGKVMRDGADANLALVEAGFAWWYREYQREQSPRDRELYAAAESRARTRGAGLWADPRAIPPWEWRDRPAVPGQDAIACPCGTGQVCTGPKGGRFCVRESGTKKYFPRD
jgi:micrococcal nuclease